jgi:hypothetical protein
VKVTLTAFGALALAVTLAIATAGIAPEQEVLTFEAKLGKVTFEHKVHAEMEGVECVSCHHTIEEGETPKSCGSCHPDKAAEGEVPKLQDAVHDNCWNCHQEKADAGAAHGPLKGFKNCKDCHVK